MPWRSSPDPPRRSRALNALIAREGTTAPVLVIGAGKVGQAAARALKQKALVVYALDRDEKALDDACGLS